jgi:hypothetical protein
MGRFGSDDTEDAAERADFSSVFDYLSYMAAPQGFEPR